MKPVPPYAAATPPQEWGGLTPQVAVGAIAPPWALPAPAYGDAGQRK